MKIVELQWRAYRLPFRHGFTTAHGDMPAREGMIVQVTTERGICGVGEIAPLPAFGGGSLADARALLPTLAARLHGLTPEAALELLATNIVGAGLAPPWVSPPPALAAAPTICGVEMALLDAMGKAEGRNVATLIAPANVAPRAAVAVNAVIGGVAREAAIAAAREAKRDGFRCVKLKVGTGGDVQEEVERVAAVRDALGADTHLRLDANEAWSLEEAIAVLSQCASYAIQYVEQPLKAGDLAGMRALRQAQPIPVAADEALRGLESARLVLESEAADVLVIKPQLAGGLRAGQQIIQAATERGVSCVITSTIESGIGVTAALHLAAALPAVTLECGLATLPLLVDDLLIDDLPIRDGFLTVPTGAGLGITLDEQALHRYGTRGID